MPGWRVGWAVAVVWSQGAVVDGVAPAGLRSTNVKSPIASGRGRAIQWRSWSTMACPRAALLAHTTAGRSSGSSVGRRRERWQLPRGGWPGLLGALAGGLVAYLAGRPAAAGRMPPSCVWAAD